MCVGLRESVYRSRGPPPFPRDASQAMCLQLRQEAIIEEVERRDKYRNRLWSENNLQAAAPFGKFVIDIAFHSVSGIFAMAVSMTAIFVYPPVLEYGDEYAVFQNQREVRRHPCRDH